MNFDPTTNRIPYGLLTPEEQATLKAWPHGWEFFYWEIKEWEPYDPAWFNSNVYRGKPAPKVKSYWFNIYEGDEVGNFWTDQKVAASCSRPSCSVLMRVDIVNGVATLTKET